MNTSLRNTARTLIAVLMFAMLGVAGCTTSGGECNPQRVYRPAPPPAPEPYHAAPAPPPPQVQIMATPAPAPAGSPCARLYWPTGDASTSSIMLEKCAPSFVQVGIPFDFTMKVSNLTNVALRNVVVTDELPNNFRASDSRPAGQSMGNRMVWQFAEIEPRGTREIVITGTATSAGRMENCITVTHELATCLVLDVVAPQLALTKSAPARAFPCDVIPVEFTITNTGVGVARNVQIIDRLPNGMTTQDGRSEVTINVGDLAQGQSQKFTINTKVAEPGRYQNTARATGTGGLTADASSSTHVVQPRLAVTKSGPTLRYVGRPMEYTITVTNNGDAEARDTVLEDPIPAGTRWINASEGGQIAGDRVVWNLGTINAGASRTVTVVFSGSQIGTITNTATARAYCAPPASGSATTEVRGIPAILLECVDVSDPVEVGQSTTYIITVTNQGSMTGTNIRMKVTLEDSMEYIATQGPTRAVQQSRDVIVMDPLPSLAPQATATWRVQIRALKPADARFSIEMNSDQIDRPVIETEATHFYK